ncbi:hypothetical protein Tco_1040418, partial [Tanacetum coccineum]
SLLSPSVQLTVLAVVPWKQTGMAGKSKADELENFMQQSHAEVNKVAGTQLRSSPKVGTSSPLVSLSTTISVPRELNSIDVAATFGVPLTTIGDLHKLINDIDVDALDSIRNSIKVDCNNADMIPLDINTKSTSYARVVGASAKDEPKVISNFRTLVADLIFDGVNISIPRKVIEKEQLEADLMDVVTTGIPSLSGDGFTKETIRIEYEWRPPRCDICKIFGHVHDYCPNKVVSPPIVTTDNVVTPTVEKTNDGFQTVGKNKKRKGKSKSTNGGQFTGPSVKQNVRYEPKATINAPMKGATYMGNTSQSSSMLKTTGNSPKKDNLSMSNSFSALNDEEDDDEEAVKNVHDESVNLIQNTKAGGSSSFTAAAGYVTNLLAISAFYSARPIVVHLALVAQRAFIVVTFPLSLVASIFYYLVSLPFGLAHCLPTELEIQEMVNILVSEEEYDKDMLHAPLEGKVLILTTAKDDMILFATYYVWWHGMEQDIEDFIVLKKFQQVQRKSQVKGKIVSFMEDQI